MRFFAKNIEFKNSKKFRGENPLDDIIEPEICRTFAILVAEDDFSADGEIYYKQSTIGGEETDLKDLSSNMEMIRALFVDAAHQRDTINEARMSRKPS